LLDVALGAGLLSLNEAHASLRRYRAALRALVEPLDADPDDAVAHADAIERVQLEQVTMVMAWPPEWSIGVLCRGARIRTGLEDTPVLPMGVRPRQGELVAAAASLLAQSPRQHPARW
jgi:hypothetical protein